MKKVEQMISGLKLIKKGKIWESYELPKFPDLLLRVATDNISTHNIVHMSTIPRKGEVLTAISIMVAQKILDTNDVKHHLVAYGHAVMQYIEPAIFLGNIYSYHDFLKRSMVVKKLNMIPCEFIYRGYMMGSLWDKYVSRRIENPYGLNFENNIVLMSRLNPAIFTPTDKSETDDPQDSEMISKLYFDATIISEKVYRLGREYCRKFEIDIIDSKFELGWDIEGNVILADEWLTPDSSRYVEISEIEEGKMPKWLDKQIARDYAQKFWQKNTGSKKTTIVFPKKIIKELTKTYLLLFERIYGDSLDNFWKDKNSFF